MIEAWIKLEDASNREDSTKNYLIDEAVAKINLFGSRKQCELCREFLEGLQKNMGADTIPLLIDLRNDLRSQLGLKDNEDVKFLFCRMNK